MDISIIDMRELSDVTEMDKLEFQIGNSPQVSCPLEHLFTPGIYTRKIFMPKDSFVISLKHKTTHPFFIMKGKVAVLKEKEDGGFEVEGLFSEGHMGVTKENTKRFLYNIEDTIWASCIANPDNIENPDEMAISVSHPNENPLINTDLPEFSIWKQDVSPSIVLNQLKLE